MVKKKSRTPSNSSASETAKMPNGLPEKLEWQIGNALFQINKRSASYTAPTKNPLATHGKEIGSLMLAYGIIKDSPGIATVGMTTASQPNRHEKGWTVRWKDVREIKFDSEKHVILLKEKWFTGGLGGGLGTYRICCTPENYETVASACQAFQNLKKRQATRRPKAGSLKQEPQNTPSLLPPPPPPPTHNCPTCGGPLTYIKDYNRWYCCKDEKYA